MESEKLFEKWILQLHPGQNWRVAKDKEGNYKQTFTKDAWEGWSAAYTTYRKLIE